MDILVIGSANLDISLKLKRLPLPGETLKAEDILYTHGGKGANQALAAALLGGEVTFLAAIGDDAAGAAIVKDLRQKGVNTAYLKSVKVPTGVALIEVDQNGTNTIAVAAGANDYCDSAYLLEHEALFKECQVVLVQMEIPLASVVTVIKLSAAYGKTLILNPAPANRDLPTELYPLISYLTPNEKELALLSNEKDLTAGVNKLLAKGVKNVIVTCGEKGALLMNRSESFLSPAFKVQAIDTVGAGDSFNGALAYALVKKLKLSSTLAFANSAAALTVTKRGAQSALPSLAAIEAFTKKKFPIDF